MTDLLFAWKVAKCVKSNAIVYANNQMTIGIGAGQMSRIYSAKIAGIKAADEGLKVEGSVMASDAFFPFRDGIEAAAKAGIKAIIHPGGSIRDDDISLLPMNTVLLWCLQECATLNTKRKILRKNYYDKDCRRIDS